MTYFFHLPTFRKTLESFQSRLGFLLPKVPLLSLSAQMQSVSAHLPHQVGDADALQVPHGGQGAQVSPLLQDVRQRLLPGSAPAHTPGHQAVPLLVLRELLPTALTPAAAHQVRSPACAIWRDASSRSSLFTPPCESLLWSQCLFVKIPPCFSETQAHFSFYYPLFPLQNPHWRPAI